MDRDFKDIGFEDFLREQTDRHKVNPSEDVWLSIHQRMHPKNRWPRLWFGVVLFGLGLATGLLLDGERSEPASPAYPLAPARVVESGDKSVPSVGVNRTKRNNTLVAALESPAQRISESVVNGERLQPKTMVVIDENRVTGGEKGFGIPGGEGKSVSTGYDESVSAIPPVNALGIVSLDADNLMDAVKSSRSRESNPSLRRDGTVIKRRKATALQLYFSPSISYRRLVGHATQSNYVYTGLPYSANLGFPTDVNKAVTHKPSVGMELGAAFAYPLSRNLRFKAGLQFNLNNYDIEAYSYTPELAPLTSAASPGYSRPINTVSYYRNFFGFSRTWLRNSHFMVSTPIGLELSVPTGKRMSLNLASTLQPTYTLRSNSYLISTNLKNYAQEPSLYRNWNLNAGAEAYLSVSKGSYKWIMGPQIRYQILSSYKDNYPISENLIDYGVKIGIQKTLK
jgi:hypothetical protein